MIILKHILERLAHSHKWIKYINKGNTVVTQSYSETYLSALAILKKIQAYALAPHSKVGLVNSDMQSFVVSLWALIVGGYTPVLLSPITEYTEKDAGFKKLQYVVKNLNIKLIMGDISKEEMARYPEFTEIALCHFSECNFSARIDPESVEIGAEVSPKNTALIMLTSGSTGNPKAVPLTHENVLSSVAGKNTFYSVNDACISMSFLPLDHVGAIIEFHLFQCFIGCNQIHVSKEHILSDTNHFLRLIDEYKVNMSMGPNFFIDSISEHLDPKMKLDLSSLQYLICGGDFVIRDTITKFVEKLKAFKFNKNCITPAFGMTETCGGITYSRDWDKGKNIKFLNLGKPIENAMMRIKNAQGAIAQEGETGELEMKGPMVIHGYYFPENDAGVFTEDGWMKTGDLGFIKEDLLYLTGRLKHEIIVNGVNYACQEVEILIRENSDNIIESSIDVIPVNVPSSNIEQFIVVFSPEVQDDDKIYNTIRKIKTLCLQYVGAQPYLVLPVREDQIPRTSIGKVDRTLLRTTFEKGALNNIVNHTLDLERKNKKYIAPATDIEKQLVELVANVLNCNQQLLSMNENLIDLGATSLKVILLQQSINNRLSVDIPLTTIIENPSLKEIAEKIEHQKTKGKTPLPYNPLVKINTVGDKPPIFMVHPGVGDVLVFVELAKRFYGERPFYAFRARGFNEGEKNFETLDDVIDSYLAAIKKAQPRPPYYLAGYSYGASIAYELGYRLEKQGDEVAFIGIINLPPYIKERMEQLNILEGFLHLCMFIGICTKEEIPQLKEILKDKTLDDWVDHLLSRKQYIGRVKELNMDHKKLFNWTLVAQSLIEIGKTFMPHETSKVKKLHIFHAIALFDTKEEWLRKLKQWDQYAREPNEYFEVPGEHYTILALKNLNKFYEIFSDALKACDL